MKGCSTEGEERERDRECDARYRMLRDRAKKMAVHEHRGELENVDGSLQRESYRLGGVAMRNFRAPSCVHGGSPRYYVLSTSSELAAISS